MIKVSTQTYLIKYTMPTYEVDYLFAESKQGADITFTGGQVVLTNGIDVIEAQGFYGKTTSITSLMDYIKEFFYAGQGSWEIIQTGKFRS